MKEFDYIYNDYIIITALLVSEARKAITLKD